MIISLFWKRSIPALDVENLDYFKYHRLPTMDHIRILILEPGEGNDAIRCHMKTLSIDAAEGEYEAISYVWGTKHEHTDIECDGKRHSIQTSLHDALRTFRSRTEQRALWADAVCINQEDHSEKGYQVRMMGEIFQKASRALCWLGRDDQRIAKSCFELVEEAARRLSQQWQEGWTFENTMKTLKLPGFISDDTKKDWVKLLSLFNLPWFGRAW
jgi:hypothetical protein